VCCECACGRVPEVPRQLQDVINWKMIAAAATTRRWSTRCTLWPRTHTNSRAINNIPRWFIHCGNTKWKIRERGEKLRLRRRRSAARAEKLLLYWRPSGNTRSKFVAKQGDAIKPARERMDGWGDIGIWKLRNQMVRESARFQRRERRVFNLSIAAIHSLEWIGLCCYRLPAEK
jgi:hypothetical protein